jgi:hypothetical protein
MKLLEGKLYSNLSIAVKTPAASMFIHITEDDFGKPIKIFIDAGKCGSEISAQTFAMAEMASKILENEDGFNELLTLLSGITTDKVKRDSKGVVARSCAEGLYIALVKYRHVKHGELLKNLGSPEFRPTQFNMNRYD